MTKLFFALSRWPLGVLHALGWIMGWLTYALSPSYRRRLRAHAGQAGLSRWQRWQAVGQVGRMVAELPRLWARPRDEALGARVQWQGAEAVAQALAEERGLLLLTPHTGCFEVVAQAYAERFGAEVPLTALYRPARQRWLAELMLHARNRPGIQTSPATLTGVRHMLRALKRGETVGILPDQVPPEGMGTWAPFFGRPAYTMTMAGKLVAQTGCAVVLMRGERLSTLARWRRGCDYVVHAERVAPQDEAVLAAGDAAQSAATINRLMEHVIMQAPEQYLWGYNRYKGPRPEALTSADVGGPPPGGAG
ncbi:lysophospholipid acyltransferase family protein [Aquabacterium fontiphilum]|uniref:lysophospholipid acyltransferase family protein n=1 Tax=Aquabacterium fontiphilum TaxID=450365 RepID=UPI00137682A2|nr:lysophospholipid acyltransferase family protein [Aquabacterium fontiphilum]NBD19157.1 lysophospholipid acyltransferase family protein [Aquabacterium fontiphilum]